MLLATYAQALLEQKASDDGDSMGIVFSQTQPITIPERLVTDLLLSSEPPTVSRIIRMKLLAAQASARYGRQTLLEWYLNTASYGHATYGFGQAAQLIFNKTSSQLNPGEVLILAVILQDASINPLDTPDLFDKSLQSASAYLLAERVVDPEVLDQASKAVAGIEPMVDLQMGEYPAFTRYVHDQLSDAIGNDAIVRGGLTITTTMDYELQTKLDCAIRYLFDDESTRDELQSGRIRYVASFV